MTQRPNQVTTHLLGRIRALPQYLLPAHLLSRGMYTLARLRAPWLKNTFIRWFVAHFKVNMTEARIEDLTAYEHFNAFFIRELKPAARPVADQPGDICCPVDGAVSQGGAIRDGRIFQAKGQDYSLLELLGGSQPLAEQFQHGAFINLYLSPRDYHRIHMPLTGTLRTMHYVPGRLFSVSPATVLAIPRLFARNERVISVFDSAAGPMAIIKVGAIFVSSTETIWAGEVGPRGRQPWSQDYHTQPPIQLNHGAELARFNMGSTVILLFAKNRIEWRTSLLEPTNPVRMGECIGKIR